MIHFDTPGIYTLRLTAFDGQYQGSDELAVVVDPDLAISSGLMAYWRFAEGTGFQTAADSSGNNRTAAVLNGAAFVSGRINNALHFDGIDDAATFDSPELSQVSVAGWLRMEGNGNSTTPRVVETPAFIVRVVRDATAGHRLSFESKRSDFAAEWRTDAGTLTDNVWYHFACVYDPYQPGSLPDIYINGVLQNITEISFGTGSLLSNAGVGYIGNHAGLDRAYLGSIDELRIYNRLLTLDEVRLLSYVSVANVAPWVNLGNDTSFFANPSTIRANVLDDGKPTPPGTISNYWRQVSGPGPVILANTNGRTTSATFPTTGTYVMQFYATDGEVLVHDEVQYTVLAAPRITSVSQAGNVTTITWNSVPGKNYRVHYKNSLSDASWTALTAFAAATSNVMSAAITNSASPRFYRVGAQ